MSKNIWFLLRIKLENLYSPGRLELVAITFSASLSSLKRTFQAGRVTDLKYQYQTTNSIKNVIS